MPKMNMNETVWIKLTDHGRQMHREYWSRFSGDNYRPPKVSHDGYSPFQMHEVMKIFGPACGIGCNLPFCPEIILTGEKPVIIEGAES